MLPVKLAWPIPEPIELIRKGPGFRESILVWGGTGANQKVRPTSLRHEMVVDLSKLDRKRPQATLSFARKFGVLTHARVYEPPNWGYPKSQGDPETVEVDGIAECWRTELTQRGWSFEDIDAYYTDSKDGRDYAIRLPGAIDSRGTPHVYLHYHPLDEYEMLAYKVRCFQLLASQLGQGKQARGERFADAWDCVYRIIEAFPDDEDFYGPPSARPKHDSVPDQYPVETPTMTREERLRVWEQQWSIERAEILDEVEAPAGLAADAEKVLHYQQDRLALAANWWHINEATAGRRRTHVTWDHEAERVEVTYRASNARPILCLATLLYLGLPDQSEICSACGQVFEPTRRPPYGLDPLCEACRGPVRNRERVRRHRERRRSERGANGAPS